MFRAVPQNNSLTFEEFERQINKSLLFAQAGKFMLVERNKAYLFESENKIVRVLYDFELQPNWRYVTNINNMRREGKGDTFEEAKNNWLKKQKEDSEKMKKPVSLSFDQFKEELEKLYNFADKHGEFLEVEKNVAYLYRSENGIVQFQYDSELPSPWIYLTSVNGKFCYGIGKTPNEARASWTDSNKEAIRAEKPSLTFDQFQKQAIMSLLEFEREYVQEANSLHFVFTGRHGARYWKAELNNTLLEYHPSSNSWQCLIHHYTYSGIGNTPEIAHSNAHKERNA